MIFKLCIRLARFAANNIDCVHLSVHTDASIVNQHSQEICIQKKKRLFPFRYFYTTIESIRFDAKLSLRHTIVENMQTISYRLMLWNDLIWIFFFFIFFSILQPELELNLHNIITVCIFFNFCSGLNCVNCLVYKPHQISKYWPFDRHYHILKGRQTPNNRIFVI